MSIWKVISALCIFLTLAACGGGGTGTTSTSPATKQYKLVLQGTVPTGVNFINFDIVLPQGVTVNMTADNAVATSSLQLSGGAQGAAITSGMVSGAIRVGIIKAAGDIPAGEIATLTVNLNGGSAPPASAFGITTTQVAIVTTNPPATTNVPAQVVIQEI